MIADTIAKPLRLSKSTGASSTKAFICSTKITNNMSIPAAAGHSNMMPSITFLSFRASPASF